MIPGTRSDTLIQGDLDTSLLETLLNSGCDAFTVHFFVMEDRDPRTRLDRLCDPVRVDDFDLTHYARLDSVCNPVASDGCLRVIGAHGAEQEPMAASRHLRDRSRRIHHQDTIVFVDVRSRQRMLGQRVSDDEFEASFDYLFGDGDRVVRRLIVVLFLPEHPAEDSATRVDVSDGEHGTGADTCALSFQRPKRGFRDGNSDSVQVARLWLAWLAWRLGAGWDR